MFHPNLDISKKSLTPSRPTSFLTLSKVDIRTVSKDLDFMVNFTRSQLYFSDHTKWTDREDQSGRRHGLFTVFFGKVLGPIKSWIPII